MKYAFINGKLLDGTENMEVQEGLVVLTDGEQIQDVVPDGQIPEGYERIDLQGKIPDAGIDQHACAFGRKRKTAEKAAGQ